MVQVCSQKYREMFKSLYFHIQLVTKMAKSPPMDDHHFGYIKNNNNKNPGKGCFFFFKLVR
jgi:hypothetical protein